MLISWMAGLPSLEASRRQRSARSSSVVVRVTVEGVINILAGEADFRAELDWGASERFLFLSSVSRRGRRGNGVEPQEITNKLDEACAKK